MAMRKMRVSFDLDMEVFAQILAKANSGMKIDMFGDEKPSVSKREPKLLTGPSVPLRVTVLNYMKENKEKVVSVKDISAVCVAAGFGKTSAYGVMNQLTTTRQVKRIEPGKYQITDKGIAHNG